MISDMWLSKSAMSERNEKRSHYKKKIKALEKCVKKKKKKLKKIKEEYWLYFK